MSPAENRESRPTPVDHRDQKGHEQANKSLFVDAFRLAQRLAPERVDDQQHTAKDDENSQNLGEQRRPVKRLLDPFVGEGPRFEKHENAAEDQEQPRNNVRSFHDLNSLPVDKRGSGGRTPLPERTSALEIYALLDGFVEIDGLERFAEGVFHAREESLELFRLLPRQQEALSDRCLLEFRIVEALAEAVHQDLHAVGGNALRGTQAAPVHNRLRNRISSFGDRRNIREQVVAFQGVDRQDSHLLVLVELDHFVDASGGNSDVAAQKWQHGSAQSRRRERN